MYLVHQWEQKTFDACVCSKERARGTILSNKRILTKLFPFCFIYQSKTIKVETTETQNTPKGHSVSSSYKSKCKQYNNIETNDILNRMQFPDNRRMNKWERMYAIVFLDGRKKVYILLEFYIY